jgi:hypothetical protein
VNERASSRHFLGSNLGMKFILSSYPGNGCGKVFPKKFSSCGGIKPGSRPLHFLLPAIIKYRNQFRSDNFPGRKGPILDSPARRGPFVAR